MYALIAVIVVCAASLGWHALTLRDRALAREFDRKVSTEAAERIVKLQEFLQRDRETQKSALEEFLRQMAKMTRFSEERYRELEMRAASKKL